MDRYNYVTATIEDEKIRLEGIINYLKGNNNEEYYKYQERYNLISKYFVSYLALAHLFCKCNHFF